MHRQPLRSLRLCRTPLCVLVLVAVALGLPGLRCASPLWVRAGQPLFLGPRTQPLALSGDGTLLYVAHTRAGKLSILDVADPANPRLLAWVPVGMEPVGVAVRPKLDPSDPEEDELVFVTNHVSDSISVVSRAQLAVVQTLQELDEEGVSRTDEPVGIAFAGPSRAFVSLDHPNQVRVVDVDSQGLASLLTTPLEIAAQAPRALTVADGRLYVAAFESGNQTEFPSCAPGDPRGLDPQDPNDMGCLFSYDITTIALTLLTLNVGGPVIRDRDVPDRDLFVFDAETLAPLDVIEGVGTLLYGVASGGEGSRVYVTHTEARNTRNGLLELEARMFENRLAFVDCVGDCDSPGAHSSPVFVDLDVSAGVPVPTPYGVAVSGDGNSVAVTAAGSDGRPGIPSDPNVQLPGLVLLDRDGNTQGRLPLGALPQGVTLRSGATGAAELAFVLDAGDAAISIVDVATPALPTLLSRIAIGPDPTPDAIRTGAVAFGSARASSSGTFSCASCHPNGSTDQLLWTINTPGHPSEGPDASGQVAEARVTMPLRGLTTTLPLHWDGSLGDAGATAPFPWDQAPDCDASEGAIDCFRHLVDTSLAGVMCDPDPSCAVGPSGLPGSLELAERDALSLFLGAIARPPAPARRPDDALSSEALEGAMDFFTIDNGLGSDPSSTCADPGSGCHALPALAGTDHVTGVDAPSFQGLWDRFVLFSSGFPSSEEVLSLLQDCADGVGPLDPCRAESVSEPSFDRVWDPAVGMTERGSLMATVNTADRFSTGLRGPPLWAWVVQLSPGLPGSTGRQRTMTAVNQSDPAIIDFLSRAEERVRDGRAVALAHGGISGRLGYRVTTGLWTNASTTSAFTLEELRGLAAGGESITVTLWPGARAHPGGEAPPQISPELPAHPDGHPNLPRPSAGGTALVRLLAPQVGASALVLLDGTPCETCSVELLAGANGEPIAEVDIDPVPAAGPHMLQLANPGGLESNELLFVAEVP